MCVVVEIVVEHVGRQIQRKRLGNDATHLEHRPVRRVDHLVGSAGPHVVQQAFRQPLGRPRRRHQAQVLVLDHQPDRDVPPWVGAVDHAQFELGEPHADPVEVDRVLHLTGYRRSWNAGVDAQRQPEFRALGVERVVHGVTGRVLTVAPKARPHNGVRHRQVRDDCGEFPQRRYRSQQVDAAHRQGEPVRLRFDELARGHRRLGEVVHQDGLRDALLVHLVEQLGQIHRREHRLRALEVVVAHLEHPRRLLLGFAEVHVDQAVDRFVRHAISLLCRNVFRPPVVRLSVAQPTDLLDEDELLGRLETRELRRAMRMQARAWPASTSTRNATRATTS